MMRTVVHGPAFFISFSSGELYEAKWCIGNPPPDIAEVFGEKPTELGVIFLHDDPTEVCPSEYGRLVDEGRAAFVTERLVQDRQWQRNHAYEMQAIRKDYWAPRGEEALGRVNHTYAERTERGPAKSRVLW